MASKRQSIFPAWKLFLCACPLIAGCATISTQSTIVRTITIPPATNSEAIIPETFNLTGRISIQDEQQRVSGGIRWQHSKTTDEVLLLSPLGQVMAQILRDHEGVRLTTSKQQVYFAADVESLTEDVLGWRIPLAGLQFWAQGTHSPLTLAMKDFDENDTRKADYFDEEDEEIQRMSAEMEFIFSALNEEIIQVITSDHTPVDVEYKKCEFDQADFGMIALESFFGALGNLREDGLSLEQIIKCIAINPRKVLGMETPSVEENSWGEFTLFDPNQKWIFGKEHIQSKSRNTPFIGKELTGKPLGIINNNILVWMAEK